MRTRSPVWRIRAAVAALGFLAHAHPACAQAGLCHDAAGVAERAAGLPDGLLDAIGQVESGRYDPASHLVTAWPWTVNAAGESRMFDNPADAAAFVRDRRRQGISSIDVGCFQVNLMHHPDAFATLDLAFDPATNATYAAHFLATLHQASGSWESAAARYHSTTPGLGEPYREQVLARWRGASAQPAAAPPPRAIQGVRVWTVSAATSGASTVAVLPMTDHMAITARLPRIITATR